MFSVTFFVRVLDLLSYLSYLELLSELATYLQIPSISVFIVFSSRMP